jgi:hypothetical protein
MGRKLIRRATIGFGRENDELCLDFIDGHGGLDSKVDSKKTKKQNKLLPTPCWPNFPL